ncbi:MAG TPA: hypothetical protein VNV86_00700, partial [Candidatus Acidoferrum sp.]|nr:hypothetical protein [Candidatus Acidoferrum sp.]
NTEMRFAIWESDGAEWLCGLSAWRRQSIPPATSERISRWRDLLEDLPHGQKLPPADLVTRVFERLGAPIPFDEAVEMMAWLWGVDDPAPVAEAKAIEVESGEAHLEVRLELSRWLSELWGQIRELPRPQRVALLLNLRSGPDTPAAALLPVTGTATIPQIAETLGFAPEEFAAIWNALPLEDLAIADRLGLTRQQVINLRKSARERLVRRLGGKYHLS